MADYPKISLKAARVNANMTQQQAAAAIGVNPTTLKRYEQGATTPRADTLRKMAKVYGIEDRYFDI